MCVRVAVWHQLHVIVYAYVACVCPYVCVSVFVHTCMGGLDRLRCVRLRDARTVALNHLYYIESRYALPRCVGIAQTLQHGCEVRR